MDLFRPLDVWNRIDAVRTESLTSLCTRVNVSYPRIKRNRTDCRLPSLTDLYLLSKGLNTSIEFLLTGNDTSEFPPRILTIAKRCLDAEEDDLRLIEKVLNIKKEDRVHIGNSEELA